jgi:hypothetical protein
MVTKIFTRKELKQEKASNYKEGDVVRVGKYHIYIHYTSRFDGRKYDRPSLCSTVVKTNKYEVRELGCTPGADRPYYIDDFIQR